MVVGGGRAHTHTHTHTHTRTHQLVHYLDIVEVALLRQISARASSFFSALVDMQRLRGEVAAAEHVAGQLSKLVALVKRARVEVPLGVVSGVRRLRNLERLRATVRACVCVCARVLARSSASRIHTLTRTCPLQITLVKEVQTAAAAAEELIGAEDYASALLLIRSTEKVCDVQLEGVKALRCVRVRCVCVCVCVWGGGCASRHPARTWSPTRSHARARVWWPRAARCGRR